ncbi:histidine N-acetyltransferase-like [Lissotriton helveticus]
MACPKAPEIDHQLKFHLATAEDFEGVMAISGDVYRGMDYLPVKYHSWLQETNRRTFVAKLKGQVVALESVCLVDAGSTAVTEGLRVAPWVRGQGIPRMMLDHIEDFLKAEFPAVKVIRLTRSQDPPSSMLHKYRLLHSKAILSLKFKAEEVKEKVQVLISQMEKDGQCFQPPVTLEAKDVMRVCTNQTVIEKILPAKMLIQNWLPVYPMKPNLDYLLTKEVTWMADNSEEPNVLSLGYPAIRVPLEGSFHRTDIDLFGVDPRSVKIHFLAQLLAISKEVHKGDLVCFLIMEKAVLPSVGAFCKDINRFVLYTEQLVMEKDI